MKTTIKGIIATFSISALLLACDQEKVMTWEPTDCVYFANPTDTSRFSFVTLPDPAVESAIFTVPVTLAGRPVGHDREFYAEVLKNARNSQTKYEIIQPSILKTNESVANIEIKLWRTPNLDISRDTITIVLKGSNDLIANMAYYSKNKENMASTRCITFYNGIDKPDWWNATNEAAYFGKYHEIKMQILKIVLGSMDNPRADSAGWYYYRALLNKYCEDNDIRYPEDDTEVRFLPGY